jgi:hypothetical protein
MFPTPASRDYRTPNKLSYQERSHTAKGEQLQNFVEHDFWPRMSAQSPNSLRGHGSDPTARRAAGHQVNLTDAVIAFPASPPAPPIPDGQPSSESAPTSRRRLNPRFVEWLMGFPIGWTEL